MMNHIYVYILLGTFEYFKYKRKLNVKMKNNLIQPGTNTLTNGELCYSVNEIRFVSSVKS